MWKRYEIQELKVSFEVYEQWPLLSWEDADVKGLYQAIEDTTGVQFIQFGPGLKLDKYVGQLGDSLNQVLLINEEQIIYNEIPVQRKRLYMFIASRKINNQDELKNFRLEGKVLHELEFEVIGLTQFKDPVVIGYRVPVEFKDQYLGILNRFIFSVRPIIG